MAFSGFRGAALNQSRSASGVYTGLVSWHERGYQESTWQESLQHQCVRWLMPVPWICRLLAHSVAGAPAVRLRRAEAALSGRITEQIQQGRKKKRTPEKATALPFFHRLRLPLTSLTFSETVCLGLGETRCGFKISTVSGRQLPPAASTFPPYRLPDTLPPFSLAGLVALSHSSRALLLCGISGDLGSSLQAWAVMQDPPRSARLLRLFR